MLITSFASELRGRVGVKRRMKGTKGSLIPGKDGSISASGKTVSASAKASSGSGSKSFPFSAKPKSLRGVKTVPDAPASNVGPKSVGKDPLPAAKSGGDSGTANGLTKSGKGAANVPGKESIPVGKSSVGNGKSVSGTPSKALGKKIVLPSPPSSAQTTSREVNSSVTSAITDLSGLGKVRVPTLIVNPADLPTTRSQVGSEKNLNSTMRRRLSEADKAKLIEVAKKRTKVAILTAAIVSVTVLVLISIIGSSMAYGLTNQKSNQLESTSTVPTTSQQ